MTQYAKSKELFEKAKTLIPGGVNSPVRAFGQVGGSPIFIKRAQGSRVADADGNEYVDFCMSWGPLILGHSRPEVVEAVEEAAKDGLSYGACHEKEIELAELILSAFPAFDKIRMVSSGTEAVMTALRLARGFTGRDFVLKFEGGYHGHYDGMLVKAGSGLATCAIASSKGVPKDVAATTIVAPLDDEEAVRDIFEKRGGEIAAVIIEPAPANNGLLLQRTEFLQTLRELTRKSGSLLIFDEVITGFRLRFGGYGESLGITPDVVTLGKIIGGGMPVGALLGSAEIMDKLSPVGAVYQAGTLSGNPVSLAAGIAALKILKKENPYPRIEKTAAAFEARLAACGLAKARAIRLGGVIWPYFDEGEAPRRADKISPLAMKRCADIYWKMLGKGYYLPPSSYEVMFISDAHSEEDAEGLAAAFAESLAQTE